MTPTEKLRRLLDEAGVEWDYGITGTASTMFNANGVELTFIGMRDGVTCSTILTPEQAVAATIGDTDATPTRQGDADLAAENAKLRERIHELEMEGSDHFYRTAYAEDANRTLEAENAKLREQMERLVTLLRNDCDIDASWDGLRKFWSIGLTEDGCLMRDRACKAEAENQKLRALLDYVLPIAMYAASAEEGNRIRELMREVEL